MNAMSMGMRRAIALMAVALMWVALPPAQAGGSANTAVGVEKFGDAAIRDLAARLNDELDARKANVALVARCGRPRAQMPRGIAYTHVALVVFEPLQLANGDVVYGYSTYNLFQGGAGAENRSYLKQELTYDFVAGAAELDIAVCVPRPALQRALLEVARSSAYAALHNPDYNVVANPWVDRFDNCVTHTLKLCVAAIYETQDRARIYRNIRAHFRPTRVEVSPLIRFGSLFSAEVSRQDMDPSGLQTATFESLRDFLAENGLTQDSFVVRGR